jgi:hypothetical protein
MARALQQRPLGSQCAQVVFLSAMQNWPLTPLMGSKML